MCVSDTCPSTQVAVFLRGGYICPEKAKRTVGVPFGDRVCAQGWPPRGGDGLLKGFSS